MSVAGARRKAALTCLLVAGGVLLQAAPARAVPPSSVSVDVEQLPAGRQAIVRLTAVASERGAAFGVEYRRPPWPGKDPELRPSREGSVFGSPISVRAVRLSGPGALSPAPGLGIKPVGRRFVCARNYLVIESDRYWLEVPANSTTSVDLLVEGSFPSWPGTEYALSLFTFAPNEPGAPLQSLGAVQTGALRPRGVLIRMRKVGEKASADGGMSPEIVGTTQPPFRNARIALRAIRLSLPTSLSLHDWSSRDAVPLGAVRTDQQGRFRLKPQVLPGEGWYGFLARSEARGARAADWNCGPFFTA